jgi:hypothetical protein
LLHLISSDQELDEFIIAVSWLVPMNFSSCKVSSVFSTNFLSNKSSTFSEDTLAVILFGLGDLFMSEMPMFQRTGMREGGLPLPPAF